MDATKKFLIERLLKEGKISKDDAIVLEREEQKDVVFITPQPANPFLKTPAQPYKQRSWIDEELDRRAKIAENCPCNPANGGSGMCGCTLTGPIITS
jgi:hypothetical protein